MNKKRLFQIGIVATIGAILLVPGDLFVIGQVMADTTAPTINITEPLDGADLGMANVSISGNVTDNVEVSSVEIFLDNISQGSPTITPSNGTTVTWNMTLTQLSQGTHNITARASDNANNTQSAMVSFVVDTEPPSITAPSPITIEVNTSGGAHSQPDITDFLAAVIIVDSIDPSPTGTNNASSFFPLGTTVVTFTATDAAGNSASDSSNINVVDTGQPIIAISQPVNGTKLNTTSITLNGTFSDFTETSVELLVDNVSQGNAALNNTEWTKTVTLTEGSHTITATGTDSSNNTASTNIDVVVDTTAPTLLITSPAENATMNTSNVALTGTSTDANGVVSIHVSIDNSTFTQANGTNSWSFNAIIADGTHNITVRATDMAGNVSKANVTIMVNTMINEITITSPIEGVKLNTSNVTITGSVTNSSHVQSIEVAIDGGVSLPVSLNTTSGIWTFGPVDLVDGNHTAQAALTDLTNNTAIVTTSFVIDTTAPVISIVSPANNATLTTTNVMLNGTASDASGITSVVVSMNGGSTSAATLEPSTGNWSFQAALTNGTHRITVTATDMSGNQAMASISVNIIDDTVIDRTMPSVDIISLGVTAIINGTNANRFNVTISGTASDNDGLASVQVKIDNDEFSDASGTTSWSFNAILSSGIHTILAKAADNSGNISTNTISLTLQGTAVDNQPPIGNQPPSVPGGDHVFSCNGQELHGKVELKHASASFIDCELGGNVKLEDSTAIFKNTLIRGNLKVEDSDLTLESTELRGNLHMEGGSLILTDNTIRGNIQTCDTEMTQLTNNFINGNIKTCRHDTDDDHEHDDSHEHSTSAHSSSGGSGNSHEKEDIGNGQNSKDNNNGEANKNGNGSAGKKDKKYKNDDDDDD